jgi:hypothetical protein
MLNVLIEGTMWIDGIITFQNVCVFIALGSPPSRNPPSGPGNMLKSIPSAPYFVRVTSAAIRNDRKSYCAGENAMSYAQRMKVM